MKAWDLRCISSSMACQPIRARREKVLYLEGVFAIVDPFQSGGVRLVDLQEP